MLILSRKRRTISCKGCRTELEYETLNSEFGKSSLKCVIRRNCLSTRRLLLLFIIVIILIGSITQAEAKCPSKANSFCLQVDGFDSILLDGSHFTNISKVFHQIAFLFEDDHQAKELDQLILINNFKLEKLERNVFCDFRFRRIVIKNCTRLKNVDKEAFNGTSRFVKSLTIDTIGLSQSNAEDFFEALNTLENLEELELKNHHILNITEYTFRQKQLKMLHLDGPLETLHNNAFFYADNLKILKLTKSIRRIKQHAFHLRLDSDQTLDIYLDCKIGSMDKRIFITTQRPLTINLYLNKLNNFDAAIFRPVLMLDIRHELILHGNPKEMRNPCQLLWLFKNRNAFKGIFVFKDEPLINEAYFNKWRCTNKMIHSTSMGHGNGHNRQHHGMSGGHGFETISDGMDHNGNLEEVHEEMNNINRAGIDASHNHAVKRMQTGRLIITFVILSLFTILNLN